MEKRYSNDLKRLFKYRFSEGKKLYLWIGKGVLLDLPIINHSDVAVNRRSQQHQSFFVPGDAVPNYAGKFLYPGTPSLTTKIFPSLFFISENKKSGVFFLAAEQFGNIFVPSRLFLIAKGAESFCQIIMGRGMIRLQFGGDLEIRQCFIIIF